MRFEWETLRNVVTKVNLLGTHKFYGLHSCALSQNYDPKFSRTVNTPNSGYHVGTEADN